MAPVAWHDWDDEEEEGWAVSTLSYVPAASLRKHGSSTKPLSPEEPPGGSEHAESASSKTMDWE